MFTTTCCNPRVFLCVGALSACLAGQAAAQENVDPLDRVRALRAVEAQRVEREFNEGRNYAYRIAPSDLDKALDRINELLALLNKDESLSAADRARMVRKLKSDLSFLKAYAADRRARAAETVSRATRIELRREADPRRSTDQRSAFDTARSRIESMGTAVADARSLRGQIADRSLGTLRKVDESAKLPAYDYELPPDWVEKSKRRSPENKLTKREKALLDALKAPITVDFNNDTFSSVIEYLQKVTGQTILVDKQALEEANISYDTPVTLRLPKVSTRTALKRLLADLGLTYVIKEEAIQVTTPARAKEMMVTRVYYIGDLIAVTDPFLPAPLNDLQAAQSIATIIQTVQSQVDPQSWSVNGGNGSIVYDPVRMSLIIKNSAEMHYMLGGGH
jgi:hypothetical protein